MLFAILVVGVACEKNDNDLIIVDLETGDIGLKDIGVNVDTETFSGKSANAGKALEEAVYKGTLTLTITNQANGDVRVGQFNFQGTADQIKETLEHTRLANVPYGTYDVDLVSNDVAQELEFSKLQLDSYDEVIVVETPLTAIQADFSPASSYLEIIVNNPNNLEWVINTPTGYYEPQTDVAITLTVTDTSGNVHQGGVTRDLLRAKVHTVTFFINLSSEVFIGANISGYDPGTADVVFTLDPVDNGDDTEEEDDDEVVFDYPIYTYTEISGKFYAWDITGNSGEGSLVTGSLIFDTPQEVADWLALKFFSNTEIATLNANAAAFGTVAGGTLTVTNKYNAVGGSITGNPDNLAYGFTVTKNNGEYVWTVSSLNGDFSGTTDNLNLPII